MLQNQFLKKIKFLTSNTFWPIYKSELGKFISISSLMFCILFNQNILRILKDSILIGEINAEITNFAKVYCVTPIATLFTIIYAYMLNKFSLHKIYNILLLFFITYFLLFAFVLYPNLSVNTKSSTLIEQHPHIKWYLILVVNWNYVLFYTLAELWPNIFYTLLFWQFVNKITTTKQAKRFYMLFSLIGNSSLIFVGLLVMHLASPQALTLKILVKNCNNDKIILTQSCIVIATVFALISSLLMQSISKNFDNVIHIEKNLPKLGIIDSFKYIISSKYLWLLLLCTMFFNFSINLIESVWKSKIKDLYQSVNSYAEFHGLYIVWTGIAILIFTIIGNNLIRKYNWFVTAITTPILIMISGSIFFFLIVFENKFTFLSQYTSISPLMLAVFVGTIQNIISKGSKYSIWDPAREMLFIPLDNELKTKGKAAVDLISSKLGKSFSGLLQSLLFTVIPSATYNSLSCFIMIVFIISCIIWLIVINSMYCEYKKIEQD